MDTIKDLKNQAIKLSAEAETIKNKVAQLEREEEDRERALTQERYVRAIEGRLATCPNGKSHVWRMQEVSMDSPYEPIYGGIYGFRVVKCRPLPSTVKASMFCSCGTSVNLETNDITF